MTLWIKSKNRGGRCASKKFSVERPSPVVMAQGMAGDSYSHWYIEDDGMTIDPPKPAIAKPAYRVPSMDEIRAIPWNGLTVASTFSGCGGSCLGYRMAGYRVVWANEFVPAAQDSYRANASANCYLDCRDIRQVQTDEVLQQIGMQPGELDLFDGSPPCQAFSTAGKREKGWGKGKKYEHGAVQCNEQLFDEYIRLLRGLQPKTFVAENVSGLVKGTAKGYFLEILSALKECGYRVRCRILDAQWLGVPQTRQRVIFVGVRDDLGMEPVHPKPLTYRYSVRDALPWIIRSTQDPHGQFKVKHFDNQPHGTITTRNAYHIKVESLPPSRCKPGAYGVQQVHPDKPCPTVTCASPGNDLAVPYAPDPKTDISRYAIGAEWDKLKQGEKSDKYLNLIRADQTKPSPTICASHGIISIASVTHPTDRRKFTIAELKRICAFPDDFILTGSYAQQWERLGNSVPPVMMKHIAEVIRDHILNAGALQTRYPIHHTPGAAR